jgi:hypothetical protein
MPCSITDKLTGAEDPLTLHFGDDPKIKYDPIFSNLSDLPDVIEPKNMSALKRYNCFKEPHRCVKRGVLMVSGRVTGCVFLYAGPTISNKSKRRIFSVLKCGQIDVDRRVVIHNRLAFFKTMIRGPRFGAHARQELLKFE